MTDMDDANKKIAPGCLDSIFDGMIISMIVSATNTETYVSLRFFDTDISSADNVCVKLVNSSRRAAKVLVEM